MYGKTYNITLSGVKDFSSNVLDPITFTFKIENEYISRKIKISFEIVKEKDVCVVEIDSGDKPIFTTDEKFYIRDGNNTLKLTPSEVSQYISNRFNS